MDDHKLFVGNMAARITQRDLWRFFSPYGPIDECAKFHESYAFVRFVFTDDAHRARRETHGATLKGRTLKVEFAATVNNSNASTCTDQKCSYIQPLRRTNHEPSHSPQLTPSPSPVASIDHAIYTHLFSPESFISEEFLTPDLLRLAGIQYCSLDDGYETNPSPIFHRTGDSRFFPISKNQPPASYAEFVSNQCNETNEDVSVMSFDFNRIRLFSDVSSGFGDDSSLFIE